MWASYGQQGHCEGSAQGPTAPSSPALPALAERRGLAQGHSLPAVARLSVGMCLRCPGNSDTFGKEILSLNVYTGAAWSGDFQLC